MMNILFLKKSYLENSQQRKEEKRKIKRKILYYIIQIVISLIFSQIFIYSDSRIEAIIFVCISLGTGLLLIFQINKFNLIYLYEILTDSDDTQEKKSRKLAA